MHGARGQHYSCYERAAQVRADGKEQQSIFELLLEPEGKANSEWKQNLQW